MATGSPDRATSPSLSQEQVVAAALAFIDEHGLEAFSMRNLARELGVYPTALYWHTGNRDQLLGLAIGTALQEIEPPDESEPWDGWLCEFARRYRASLHRHPNLASIVGLQMVNRAVTEIQIIEVLLSKLDAAGFGGDDLVDAYNTLIGCVVGFVSLELTRLPEGPDYADEVTEVMGAMDPTVLPHLVANRDRLANRAFGLRWSTGTQAPLDSAFELVLTSVMLGLKGRLGQG